MLADHLAEAAIVQRELGPPNDGIPAIDAVTARDVAEIAGLLANEPAVACVGPHATADFA